MAPVTQLFSVFVGECFAVPTSTMPVLREFIIAAECQVVPAVSFSPCTSQVHHSTVASPANLQEQDPPPCPPLRQVVGSAGAHHTPSHHYYLHTPGGTREEARVEAGARSLPPQHWRGGQTPPAPWPGYEEASPPPGYGAPSPPPSGSGPSCHPTSKQHSTD